MGRTWNAFDRRARCEKCYAVLDYEKGSLRWQSLDNDLCAKHAAEAMVEKVIAAQPRKAPRDDE